ncbi:MAG: hypothetical protein RL204_1280 [Bacteroidota bacterium]|jgi:uncharacterized protein YjbI with pentapeptide repeats
MMLNSKSIGDKIASARKKANLSQAALAQHVSISSQAVGKWERGESMPDITTLNRIAEILSVDLNYFSDNFTSTQNSSDVNSSAHETATTNVVQEEKSGSIWNMSQLNLMDSDFSGLKNLHEKFNSSNILNCKFESADLSGIQLSSNNVESCDFNNTNFSRSTIHNSNLDKNNYQNCNLQETTFTKSNIGKCDFTGADLTKAVFKFDNFSHNLMQNAVLNGTSFISIAMEDITLEGKIENCHFEDCSFYGVTFQNAIITNTFFKNNRKMKKVEFINCKVDKITYAFLKTNQADMSGIEEIPSN